MQNTEDVVFWHSKIEVSVSRYYRYLLSMHSTAKNLLLRTFVNSLHHINDDFVLQSTLKKDNSIRPVTSCYFKLYNDTINSAVASCSNCYHPIMNSCHFNMSIHLNWIPACQTYKQSKLKAQTTRFRPDLIDLEVRCFIAIINI